MSELVDLKRTPEDKKEVKEDHVKFGEEDYAWGTRMHLDEIEADKVGLMECNVGDEVEIVGVAKVIGKSVRESESTGTDGHVEIQMIKMGATKAGKTSAAEKLYGDKKDDTNAS